MMRRTLQLSVLALVAVALAGCVGGIAEPKLEPKLSPPVIGKPGVLRVAVDMSYPPFAGKVGEDVAGLDVDVAAALADALGLKLELVDAKPDAAAALVQSGTVDAAIGLTIEQAVNAQLAFAGTYVSDGPALFASGDATFTPESLATKRIAVQEGSLAYWVVLDEYGADPIVKCSTLADALAAVESGNADVAAGDALVGAYLLRDHASLSFAGQMGTASPLGVAVSIKQPKLEAEVRATLDRLASEGVLETLRRKWVGDLQVLSLPDAADDATSTP